MITLLTAAPCSIPTELGVGGIFAILLFREFMNVYNKVKNGNGYSKGVKVIEVPQECHDKLKAIENSTLKVEKATDGIKHDVKRTWDAHNVRDSDGNPVWYSVSTKKSVDRLNAILTTHIEKQNAILNSLNKHIKNFNGGVNNA